MANYTHLSQEERYSISAELKRQTSIREIARILNRHPSSISREIQRNKGKRGYRPQQAGQFSAARKYVHQVHYTDFAFAFVEHLLQCKWSPEQISGALRSKGWTDVPSHEWLYRYIYKDKAKGGKLHLNLRSQKTYRKRGFASNDRRGVIKDRVSIHTRPDEINQRTNVGDFEGDLIVGAHHQGAVLTLVDRKSLFTLMRVLTSKHAKTTMDACVNLIKGRGVKSITFDNGKEFAHHAQLKSHGVDAYFADPYCSNQRARNENTNGLIRQYLPKGTSFDKLNDQEVKRIQDALNHRPRKSLQWLTPAQVYSGFLSVALQC